MQHQKFDLREANENDLTDLFEQFAQVQSIHAGAEPKFFREPVRDDDFDRHFRGIIGDPEQHLVVAHTDGRPAGHVQFALRSRAKNIYQPARRFAFIQQLVVLKVYRRSGCATALIDFVKAEASKQNISMLGIDFWSFNEPARACFEYAGFVVNQEHMWLDL